MNNFDPTRPMVPAPGADLAAFFAAMQHQMQTQNLPQMQMPVQANMPGVQWQGQFWPQQQPQQQQQQWIPGPGPSAGPQLQAVPQPSVQSLQSMFASVYQLCVQQQQQLQQQQVPHLYLPPLQPQPPPPAQQQTQLSSPVGAMIDDEAHLIEALKSYRGKGITPRQALEKLHGVRGS